MEWKISEDLVEYPDAVAFMEDRVAQIRGGRAGELVWFLEHPPVYTAGTSARAEDLLHPRFPVFETGRGGQYTYHGPGQLVAYVMLDLKKRQAEPDIRKYIHNLEQWIINALHEIGIEAERRQGRVGLWVSRLSDWERRAVNANVIPREDKIAAIGVRIRHWVTYHGVSINIDPDLGHFEGIVPCGILEHGVCSARSLGIQVSQNRLQEILKKQWDKVFTQSAA